MAERPARRRAPRPSEGVSRVLANPSLAELSRVLVPVAALLAVLASGPAARAQSRPPSTGVPGIPTVGTAVPATRAVATIPPRPTITPSPSATTSAVPLSQVVAATVSALDAVATAVAATVTAMVVPTAAPSATRAPSSTSTASPSPTSTPTPTVAPTITPPPTVNPLASSRTVITTAPISVGGETFAPGAPLEIPIQVSLENGAIPPGTTIRLPDGQVLALPSGTSIPAVENAAVVGAPLNAVLPRAGLVGDVATPPGAVLTLPSGTTVYGDLTPESTVLLPSGSVVELGGRSETLVEPLQVVISTMPVELPAVLPATGDAAPVLWPAGLGFLLVLAGWRLRRSG